MRHTRKVSPLLLLVACAGSFFAGYFFGGAGSPVPGASGAGGSSAFRARDAPVGGQAPNHVAANSAAVRTVLEAVLQDFSRPGDGIAFQKRPLALQVAAPQGGGEESGARAWLRSALPPGTLTAVDTGVMSLPGAAPDVLLVGPELPRPAAAEAVVAGLEPLAPGGVLVLDGLSRDYTAAAGYPFTSRRRRYVGTDWQRRTFSSSTPASPLGPLDLLSDILHTHDDPPGSPRDVSQYADPRAARLAAATSSIDCWPDVCFVRKSGGGPQLSAAAAAALGSRPLWSALALQAGVQTDKVTTHTYGTAYDRYLPLMLGKTKIRMLEIGLGCGMPYGPGHSAPVWQRFFGPALELTVIEYDRECGGAWAAQHAQEPSLRVYLGDQKDPQLLAKVVMERGPFDVVVDDGGHSMAQQLGSLRGLFPGAVVPGGLYFLEDLQTSHYDHWIDSSILAVGYVQDLVDLVVGGQSLRAQHQFVALPHPSTEYDSKASPPGPRAAGDDGRGFTSDQIAIADALQHVDCFAELCVLVRKP